MLPVSSPSHRQFTAARGVVALTILLGWSSSAFAAGTAAGTTISNTATATYNETPSSPPKTVDSNTVDIKVDELLDVVVDATDSSDVSVLPGATNQVLTYKITNTGNGSEAFALTSTGTVGGDNFDPTTTSIVIDTNNNGQYDPGVDTVYTPGSNDPVLAADESKTIFVLSTIPAGAADAERGIVRLVAAAKTGTGTPGTVFGTAGDGGGDAVVGSTGADAQDEGAFKVSSAVVALVKSATVADPFGGAESVPGSIITYTLVATVSGSGSLSNLAIGDVIPTKTKYEAGTLTLQGSTLTDAADTDEGTFNGSAVNVALGTVSGGSTRTVTFKVKID